MPAIGMGLLWGGYTLVLWGYTLLQGYEISIGELVVPGRYTGDWPPPKIKDDADVKPKVNPKDHPGDMPWTYPDDKGVPASTGKSSGGRSAQV